MTDQVKAPVLSEPKRTKSPMNSFHLTEITPDEIVRIITKFFSAQVNDIPTTFLKYVNVLIAPIHSKIYNKCIREGIFRRKLKNYTDYPCQ